MIEEWRLPPKATDLRSARKEIRVLYGQLYRERQQLVKQIERRVQDNRACAGSLKSLREENAELRRQLAILRRTHE